MLIGPIRATRGSAAFLRRRAERLASDVSGTTVIEYVLIASLIGIAIIGGAKALGLELGRVFDSLGAALSAMAAL
ncbi:Flp family type IVb pilin [Aurantimonas sp. Leaf443]|uniref:Flp family type IVb pilin n=1 Tax=Aurantimonas sp. Leaf443 TaxID=1736378 RepID=UPI0006FF20AF|nr:Flp family type IVb pilin [Aurantimonas sp. Leaf443]KQT85877.1 hypothetical protein ASG48_04515 [Aurantimonas sp. Leaf443]